MKRSRFVFWLILVLFVAGTGWWMCSVPYNPGGLYSAIPLEAEYISVSRHVAARWETFLQNPLTRSLVISLGADIDELDELSEDESMNFWMQRLFSDEVVIANTPAFSSGDEDTWIITTWLGGRSLYYRWLLPWMKDKRLSKAGSYGGRTIWCYDTRKWDFPHPLFFVFVEGGIIGCMSPYASTIQYVLDTYDGRISPVVKPFLGWLEKPATALDRGWVRLPANMGWPAFTYALSSIGSNTISGSLGADVPWMKPGVTLDALNTNILGRLLGDLPLAAVVVPFDTSDEEWLSMVPVDARKILTKLTVATRPQIGMVALMGGEYSGRVKGLKLPGIVTAFQMENPGRVLRNAQQAVDQLNAAYKWGLIAGRYPVGRETIYVIESTADTPYALLNSSECVAFTVIDNWFLMAGSAGTLGKLVTRYNKSEARIEARAGRWQKEFHPDLCAGFGWMDLMDGGKVIRNAIAAYSLKLMIEDASKSQKQRQQFNEIRAWIEGLGTLETCWIWMETGEGWVNFRFQMGYTGV